MDDDALTLVADASAAAAGEIRDHLADCLRRLDLVNLPLPAAHLSFAIDMLDEDIRRLTTTSVSELG
jgi:hypothetical protein